MPDFTTDLTKAAKDIANLAKDATYVVIGAGVLGFQQLQVHRQELINRLDGPTAGLGDRVAAVRSDVNEAVRGVDAKLDVLLDRVEQIIDRVEAAVAPFEERLPTQARDLATQAHAQAREARTQLRTFRTSAVA